MYGLYTLSFLSSETRNIYWLPYLAEDILSVKGYPDESMPRQKTNKMCMYKYVNLQLPHLRMKGRMGYTNTYDHEPRFRM